MLIAYQRQHVVDALKAKVAELQGSIARIIKERDRDPQAAAGATMAGNNKPIVGLNAWMSSSSPAKEAEVRKALCPLPDSSLNLLYIVGRDGIC